MGSWWQGLQALLFELAQAGRWWTARRAVDAVRYRPAEMSLSLACAAGHAAPGLAIGPWLAEARAQPLVRTLAAAPHAVLRQLAFAAERTFGAPGSAFVRWYGGAVAAVADHLGAAGLHRMLAAPSGPAMLVPHPHDVVVLAADMRGFSRLTTDLADTDRLTDLVGEYLTVLTDVVERHRGVVFQYTGDGLLAVFLPELSGLDRAALLERVVTVAVADLHGSFDALYARWRAAWLATGHQVARIGLGTGLSFGRTTLGFMGPSGKKHVGVIGEPVNVAAYLCSQAPAGSLLVDRQSFDRVGVPVPLTRVGRIRSKKPHQRLEVAWLRYGTRAPRLDSRERRRPLGPSLPQTS